MTKTRYSAVKGYEGDLGRRLLLPGLLAASAVTSLAEVPGPGVMSPPPGRAAQRQFAVNSVASVSGLPAGAPSPTSVSPTPTQVDTPTAAPAPPIVAERDAAVARVSADKRLFSFRAENLELKSALAMFARANNLNIVPDQDVTGAITVDVHDLPLKQMMSALLDAHDFSWNEQEGLIRVKAYTTRNFNVDYLRLNRTGKGMSMASLSSGNASGGMGGGGGGMGGGGGGSMGGGGGSGGSSSSGGGGSSITLTAENQVDFWTELRAELERLLTTKGKDTMAMNKTAGLIQITDRPSNLRQVEEYILNLGEVVQRQVDIEAQLYNVTLNDQFQFGIDWVRVVETGVGTIGMGGATSIATPIAGKALPDSFNLVFSNDKTKATLTALQQQGNLTVISKPRVRTLNNQTALIKVGQELPFFNSSTDNSQSAGGNFQSSSVNVTMVTVGTILAITPQISSDKLISLDISPVLTEYLGSEAAGDVAGENGGVFATAPKLDTKQASTMVRVPSGYTVVIGGLIQDKKSESRKKVPLMGDIPLLGKLFQGVVKISEKNELVIFVTPTIVP